MFLFSASRGARPASIGPGLRKLSNPAFPHFPSPKRRAAASRGEAGRRRMSSIGVSGQALAPRAYYCSLAYLATLVKA